MITLIGQLFHDANFSLKNCLPQAQKAQINWKLCVWELVLLLFSGTKKNILGTLEIRKKIPEIADLEFEDHGFLKNHVCLWTEQAGTNIC